MSEMAERIRLARKEKKLSQQSLAGLVGVSRPAVTQWETGAIPEKARLDSLCEALEVDPAWLSGFGERLPIRRYSAPPLDSALMGAMLLDWSAALRIGIMLSNTSEFANLDASQKTEAARRLYILAVREPSKLNADAASAICLSVA